MESSYLRGIETSRGKALLQSLNALDLQLSDGDLLRCRTGQEEAAMHLRAQHRGDHLAGCCLSNPLAVTR